MQFIQTTPSILNNIYSNIVITPKTLSNTKLTRIKFTIVKIRQILIFL